MITLPRKVQIGLSEAALSVVRQSGLSGFPVYAKRVSPQHLLVSTERGRQIFNVRPLFDPESLELEYAALALGYDYGEIPVAKIDNELRVVESYPWNVPRAIAFDPSIMVQIEADVWARRLYNLYHVMEIRGEVEGYQLLADDEGCIALRDKHTGDVHAWINTIVGRVYIVAGWTAKWRGLGDDWVSNVKRRINSITGRILAGRI
ncbi:MAG: hypothetical protein LRS48_04970 [Desulfurococcales archaeon]|nr:hypothetical protein [Desulfurococcales archaeon]